MYILLCMSDIHNISDNDAEQRNYEIMNCLFHLDKVDLYDYTT